MRLGIFGGHDESSSYSPPQMDTWTRQDLVCGEINPSDFTRLLTMREPTCNLKEGEWAQVRKGLYKGDVGLVVAVENWGMEVLLPPRLNPPISSSGLKRK